MVLTAGPAAAGIGTAGELGVTMESVGGGGVVGKDADRMGTAEESFGSVGEVGWLERHEVGTDLALAAVFFGRKDKTRSVSAVD